MGDKKESKYVSAAEIAAYFEVTDAAVYQWVKQGRIQRDARLGRAVKIPREEFEYVKAHGLRPATREEEDERAPGVLQPIGA